MDHQQQQHSPQPLQQGSASTGRSVVAPGIEGAPRSNVDRSSQTKLETMRGNRERKRPNRRRRLRASTAVTAGALCFLSSTSSSINPLEIASAFQIPSQLPLMAGKMATEGQTRSRLPRASSTSAAATVAPSSLLRIRASSTRLEMATSSIDKQNVTSSSEDAEIEIKPSESSIDNSNTHGVNGSLETKAEATATNHIHSSEHSEESKLPPLLQKVVDKVGKIDESRIMSTPEYLSGDVPKLYSNLVYETTQQSDGTNITVAKAKHADDANFLSSSALLCGTALGCGLLNLPTAISEAGYLPSLVATLVAWAYMTISALLTSELLLNRYGETGRARNVGLMELYGSYLGENGGKLAGVGFLIVNYVVMGIYLSEGGDQLVRLYEMASNSVDVGAANDIMDTADGGMALSSISSKIGDLTSQVDNRSFIARSIFAAGLGTFLAAASKYNTVQKAMTHVFVPLTLVAFVAAVSVGLPTADFGSLVALENQHPEVVLNAFPLLFMSWTYHGVVPRVVYDLEGDKDRITKAIIVGSSTALVIYLTWNAMILGNVMTGSGGEITDLAAAASSLVGAIEDSSAVVLGDMVGVNGAASSLATPAASVLSSSIITAQFEPPLQSSVAVVSELAVITSLIGVVLGFVNEFNDAIGDAIGTLPIELDGPKEDINKWKVALSTLLPPAAVSIALGYYSTSYDIDNYNIIDYTGIFGASVLFLILPALMAWQNRYGEEDPPRPLTVRPMVPLGKIALSSLYKAAGTLILEQGLEKLGVFEFVQEHIVGAK